MNLRFPTMRWWKKYGNITPADVAAVEAKVLRYFHWPEMMKVQPFVFGLAPFCSNYLDGGHNEPAGVEKERTR